ncbi:MAG: hypothetical protein R3B46_08570 [Phycisphaerales bacterium]|nr:hypothetical protein [Phycisphaerales bacterium]
MSYDLYLFKPEAQRFLPDELMSLLEGESTEAHDGLRIDGITEEHIRPIWVRHWGEDDECCPAWLDFNEHSIDLGLTYNPVAGPVSDAVQRFRRCALDIAQNLGLMVFDSQESEWVTSDTDVQQAISRYGDGRGVIESLLTGDAIPSRRKSFWRRLFGH